MKFWQATTFLSFLWSISISLTIGVSSDDFEFVPTAQKMTAVRAKVKGESRLKSKLPRILHQGQNYAYHKKRPLKAIKQQGHIGHLSILMKVLKIIKIVFFVSLTIFFKSQGPHQKT